MATTATVNPDRIDWDTLARRGVHLSRIPEALPHMPFLFHADAIMAADRRARRLSIPHRVIKVGRLWLVIGVEVTTS